MVRGHCAYMAQGGGEIMCHPDIAGEYVPMLEDRLKAADELAKAATQMLGGHANLYMSVHSAKKPDGSDLFNPDDDLCRRELKDALAAYERLRED